MACLTRGPREKRRRGPPSADPARTKKGLPRPRLIGRIGCEAPVAIGGHRIGQAALEQSHVEN
eukprot:5701288-Prymnesium_polylepis.1